MPEWISVKDKLPDDDTIVLVYAPQSGEPARPGYHHGDEWRWETSDCIEYDVTHWMPMPEPPEVTDAN